MTLVVGARCCDGVILAADRRRLAGYEKGPESNKLFKLSRGVLLAGAGDDAVLNEASVLIERRVAESSRGTPPDMKLSDVLEITCGVVNELVGIYRDKADEPFGFVLSGLENVDSGDAKLYTIFGAGFSDAPWACVGSGGKYARSLVDLLLAPGDLTSEEAARVMPVLFSLVSSVQTTVGGGVDTCVVRDDHGPGPITHRQDVGLGEVRAAILSMLDIKAK